jgi:hypothetical protein
MDDREKDALLAMYRRSLQESILLYNDGLITDDELKQCIKQGLAGLRSIPEAVTRRVA